MRNVVSWRRIQLLSQATTSPKAETLSEFIAALNKCGKTGDLENGKSIHRRLQESGLHRNILVVNTLIAMYSKCRCMEFVLLVCEKMPYKDVVTWNSLIQGYTENGQSLQALNLLCGMSCEPNHVTFLAALRACAALASSDRKVALEKGKALHEQARSLGHDSNIFVASTLVDMYSKCGDMVSARETFESITSKGVVSWNCLLMGYTTNGESRIALELFFTRMDCEPNHVTYLALLKACALSVSGDKAEILLKGNELHEQVNRRGLDSHADMYSKLGNVQLAKEVFDGMKRKDVVTWNCLISGYVHNKESLAGLELFARMDCQPDPPTWL